LFSVKNSLKYSAAIPTFSETLRPIIKPNKLEAAKSEITLVAMCRKGDPKAQFRLYRLYVKAMYNVAVRMVADSHVAEDITQEAFIKAFTGLGSLKNDGAFGSWIKRIVMNLCVDYTRKQKLVLVDQNSISFSEPAGEEVDDGFDPAVVHELIKKLPDGARQILVMRAVEGMKHAEIGEMLGVSASTVKTQFFRAKNLLAKMMEEYNETGFGEISGRTTVSA
jgi:RNA polymerase sigma-70 factor (ECF subfamily)